MSEHSVMGDTIPNDGAPGGRWLAVCSCGWSKEGRYARSNEIAEAVALRLANAYGNEHEKNPEITDEEPAGQDHPREDRGPGAVPGERQEG